MRVYETIFIARPDLNEEALAERVEWFKGILASQGAQVLNVEQWGKKRLAYKVEKQRYGIYVLVHYEGGPHVVSEVERHLRMSEDILRYITVRLEGRQAEAAREAAKKAAAEQEQKAKAEAEAEVEAKVEETPVVQAQEQESPGQEVTEEEPPEGGSED
jgi:small subunit ribosomal protein S6